MDLITITDLLAVGFSALTTFLVATILTMVIRPFRTSDFAVACLYLLMLTAFATMNLRFGFFEQKAASELSFEAFRSYFEVVDNPLIGTFHSQALLNAFDFALTNTWTAAIGTNCGLTAGAFLYVRSADNRAAWWLVAPASINFSLFALRDPVIGLLLLLMTFALSRRNASDIVRGGLVLFALIAMYFTRPETLLVFVAVLAVAVFVRSRSMVGKALTAGGALFGGYGALTVAPSLLGVQGNIGVSRLPAFFANFSESRGVRANVRGVGSGSQILGGRLFDLPLPIRYPIQLITFFVLPLPFELRSVGLLLAAVDSVVFAFGTWKLWREGTKAAKLLFVTYVLVVAFFSSNYGNVFRIRYPLYFVIAAGLTRISPFGTTDEEVDPSLERSAGDETTQAGEGSLTPSRIPSGLRTSAGTGSTGVTGLQELT